MEIKNRKARFNYFIEKTYEAGIVLSGTEIKSVRKGSANFNDSYISINGNEAFIKNMYIAKYEEGNRFNHDERRDRKLLLHRNEIKRLQNEVQTVGYTIVPVRLYFKGNYAKIEIGLAKGKKLYDKRESIKKRDLDREMR
ncbi:MAG TPA: SsrA-binding protein, partial [Firmicutes bacterium]|nr:SsrA-binding protein [Bacillota bacterium]